MTLPREFRPEKVSRTGEIITWILAVITVITLVFLWSQNAGVSIWQVTFTVLMLTAAGGSSLSSWMDRSTVLILRPEGVDFRNGLRDVSVNWDDLEEVQIFPSRFGNRVNVFGSQSHFNFRTMVEVTNRSGRSSSMGFSQGEFITQQIIKNSGLQETLKNDRARYYARP